MIGSTLSTSGPAYDTAGFRNSATPAKVSPRRGRVRNAMGRRPASEAESRNARARRVHQPMAGNERAPLWRHGEGVPGGRLGVAQTRPLPRG